MLRISIRKLAVAVCAVALTMGNALAENWDLPTGWAPTNFHVETMDAFAKGVNTATGGKLTITVHPSASLYKMPDIKRAVQQGQVPIGEFLMLMLVNESPIYAVDGLPFLANSYAAAKKLWTVQRPYVERQLDAQGLMLLYAVPWPPQGLYVPKEVNSMADLAGLNWRASDKTTARMGEIFRARPVTVNAAEVAQALATGRINSFFSSAQSGVDYKVWESLKYWYDVQGWLPKNMVVANKAAFNKLDKPVQDALLAQARKAEENGWALSMKVADATKQVLIEHGMKVAPPSPKLSADLQAMGKQMVDEWLVTAGPEGKAIIDAYRK